jgi:apolipoprotein N-acyltransferase
MFLVTSRSRLGLAVLSAVLLNLCFPLAGPLPVWRMIFAWFGAVPLLLALLASEPGGRPLWRGFFSGWVFGFLWYAVNCYWIYQTMYLYGGLPASVSVGILLLFSLIMGLYYGLFDWEWRGAAGDAISVDGDRSIGRAFHQGAVGPAWILADR